MKNICCKVSAHVDDLLFSLTNPHISLPNLLQEFEIFWRYSNLKINYSKSEAMGVGIPTPLLRTLNNNFQFQWTETALRYLGTFIPHKLCKIYKLNFPPILTKSKNS